MQPNLFIVGAPKCGTTAWVEYLSTHPDVYFSPVKEPLHFCTDFPGFRAYPDRTAYEALFANSGSARVRGEASVMYLFSMAAAKEIAAYNRDARIIIFVRRQEDFLPSLHNQLLFNGDETIEDFETAWRLSPVRTPPRSCREPRFLDYMAEGRFHEQVRRYIDSFGADKVRVFHFDDWTREPIAAYREIIRFLDLRPDGRLTFPKVNEAERHRVQLLGRFTQSPPPWAIKASALAKRVTGGANAPLVGWIRSLNRTSGYRSTGASEQLAAEIRSYFAQDNRLLEPLIWRPRG